MRLLCHEWRKLLRLPVLWGFLALCLAFNGLLLYQADTLRGWFNQGSALASTLGQRMDEAFVQALEQQPPSEYGSAVLDAARTGENIFETFQLDKLCAYYQNGVLQHSPWAQEKMAEKYAKLAPRQAHLAQTQAALDLYAGPATQAAHQFLYGTLFRALTAEGAILGMLGTLFLLGYEGMHRTTLMVYSTRTGRRRLVLGKLTAGALAAGALFLLLCAVTLAAYFTLWDYRGVWGASVSSQFNYITEMLVRRPFLPWADFTVGGYLAAVIALGTLLCGACALLAGLIGTLTPNVYSAALLLVLLLLGGTYLQTLAAQEEAWQGYFLLNLQPTATWLNLSGWFTELGLSALVPWQETKATLLCLALFAGGGALAAWFTARKDVS